MPLPLCSPLTPTAASSFPSQLIFPKAVELFYAGLQLDAAEIHYRLGKKLAAIKRHRIWP